MMIILCPSTKILISIYNLLTVPPFFPLRTGFASLSGHPGAFMTTSRDVAMVNRNITMVSRNVTTIDRNATTVSRNTMADSRRTERSGKRTEQAEEEAGATDIYGKAVPESRKKDVPGKESPSYRRSGATLPKSG